MRMCAAPDGLIAWAGPGVRIAAVNPSGMLEVSVEEGWCVMRFLVTGTYTEPGALLVLDQGTEMVEGRIIPSLAILADWEEKEGKIHGGGVFAGGRVAAFVIDADTGEEIGKILTALPFWHDITWDVTPLQSFRSAVERETAVLENFKAAMER